MPHTGVRKLSLADQAPNCEIFINQEIYNLPELAKNKMVVDIGCGYGNNKPIVLAAGGTWVGVEPFEGGAHTVLADARNLPFKNNYFDVAIMDSVLEHIPTVERAFSEVSRVLKKGGLFIGYVAFMECFHEISYNHISFKALENYAMINGMKLIKISGGRRFGIDYHIANLLWPLPFELGRIVISKTMRGFIRLKTASIYIASRLVKKRTHKSSVEYCELYYKLECLRYSNGFSFVIKKL